MVASLHCLLRCVHARAIASASRNGWIRVLGNDLGAANPVLSKANQNLVTALYDRCKSGSMMLARRALIEFDHAEAGFPAESEVASLFLIKRQS